MFFGLFFGLYNHLGHEEPTCLEYNVLFVNITNISHSIIQFEFNKKNEMKRMKRK